MPRPSRPTGGTRPTTARRSRSASRPGSAAAGGRTFTFRARTFDGVCAKLASERCLLVEGPDSGAEGLHAELRYAEYVNAYQGIDGRLWAVAQFPDGLYIALLGGSRGPGSGAG